MKRISVVALTALGVAVLACGGGSDEGGGDISVDDGGQDDGDAISVDLPTVPLTEPWTSMNLPIGSGQIVLSDDSVMLVGYNSGSISGLTSDYSSAIVAAGWTQKEDYSVPEFTAILFEKSGKEVGFAVGEEEGITFAYMEDLSKVGEEESTIAGAKRGKRGIRKGSGRRTSGGRSGVRKGSGSKTPGNRGGGKKTGKQGR